MFPTFKTREYGQASTIVFHMTSIRWKVGPTRRDKKKDVLIVNIPMHSQWCMYSILQKNPNTLVSFFIKKNISAFFFS
jgi:hypothetical protein